MSQKQAQDVQTHSSPKLVFERMIQATNRHDLEAMVALFAPDYRSEQPFHPERNFVGSAGVRKNWNFFFTTIPDIQIEILGEVEEGDTVWAELHYHGTQTDGTKQSTRGVTLMGIQADQIIWTRLYIEEVKEPHRERKKGVSPMSTEDNKALVRRWYEDFNRRNLAIVDELFTPDYVYHNPPTTLHGPEEFKQFLSLYLTAFPDARFTVEDELAEGDLVASRSTLRGTHQGEFMGIPPTGKPVTVTGMSIDRIVGGKFVEGWLNFDALGMLQQLGVIGGTGDAATNARHIVAARTRAEA